MSYWGAYRRLNRGIVAEYERTVGGGQKVVLIDGGAAGKLSEPFDQARSALVAVRFEPRGEEEVISEPADLFVDGALWSKDGPGTLHITKDGSTSSVRPPNLDFLAQFNDRNGITPRRTVRTVPIQMRSVDSCVLKREIPPPNFIKLDVHSSELPALFGSRESLQSCFGMLIETWNVDVHIGQGLHFQVEEFCIQNGFEVYDLRCAARWLVKHRGAVFEGERARYVGSEILVFREHVPEELLTQKALVLSLFGFYSSALNALDTVPSDETQKLRAAIKKARKAANRGRWWPRGKVGALLFSLRRGLIP